MLKSQNSYIILTGVERQLLFLCFQQLDSQSDVHDQSAQKPQVFRVLDDLNICNVDSNLSRPNRGILDGC